MTQQNTITVLGVYLGHDLGACLLRNGEIIASIEEERLNRFKHGRPNDVAGLWPHFSGKFGYFPWASVCYCLEAAGLMIDEVDLITVGDALWASAAEETIGNVIPVKDKRKIVFVNEPCGAVHHFHHALSGFMASPFEEAAVLVVDGDGNSNEDGYEAETGFYFASRDGKHREVFKNRYTDTRIPLSGIGWTYEQVTYLLGFSNRKIFLAEPGKTMGLAPYGKPRPEFDAPWITYDGFRLNFTGFHHWLKESGNESRVLSGGDGLAYVANRFSQYGADLAFKVQTELEKAVLHLATELQRATGARTLCLAGGVALNSVANGVVLKSGRFERIFIQPAAHDGGQAIGLAYHGHLMLTADRADVPYMAAKVKRNGTRNAALIHPMKNAYCGRSYEQNEIKELLSHTGLDFAEVEEDALIECAASDLACRKIIGWVMGGSEIGPRALGGRSILANPDRAEMKDLLNSRVKFREGFRPFAPSVLLEKASEVFELDCESPYMLVVVPVRRSWANRVPAVVHVDGTARVQTVDRKVEPRYHALISAFERHTGIPLVLNTSFNLRGMPIVESPYDALQCFLLTDMDALYMGRFRIDQSAVRCIVAAKTAGWEFSEKRDLDTGALTLTCQSYEHGKMLTCNFNARTLALVANLDGRLSIEAAYRQVSGGCDDAGLREVTLAVQWLAREGALDLKLGTVSFPAPISGHRWWHKAVATGA
jgi:carbamoyltransferase